MSIGPSLALGQSVAAASMGGPAPVAPIASLASPLAIAGASVGAILGTFGAIQTNRALRNTLRNAANATSIELQNNRDAATVERLRIGQRLAAISGSVVASAAERGLPVSGSIEDLLLVNANNAAVDRQILAINERNRAMQVRAQYAATVSQARSQQQNALLSLATGGLQGFVAGNTLGSGIDSLRAG